MRQARIYQRGKSSMQSGRARAQGWVLELEPDRAKRADPLTGWAGSGDVESDQVVLGFPTLAAAQDYARARGIDAHVVVAGDRSLKLQAYADNFAGVPIAYD